MNRLRIAPGKLSFGAVLVGVLSALAAVSARADSTNVSIVDFAFNPSAVSIQANDRVIWNWVGPTVHTSTSDTGDATVWDSGFLNAGASKFTNTFAATGTFPYHCTIHASMKASVTVHGQTNVSIADFAFNPPSVSINPNDKVIWNWVGPTVHTSTSDTGDKTVWDSGFLTAAAPNFTNTFTSSGTFPYHCTIHASMTGSVVVQGPVQSHLSSPGRLSNTSFQFTYSATPGANFIVQRSADLINWTSLATNNAAGNQATFTDIAAPANANFYRVKLTSSQ